MSNSGPITKDEILATVVTHLKIPADKIVLKNYEVKAASDGPLGFLGDHAKVVVQANVDGKDQELHYFVKQFPTAVPQQVDYISKIRAFYKEVQAYTTLFKDYEEVDKLVERGVKWRPEFFHSRGEEVLIMEDLSLQGYGMYPERTLLDEEYMRAGLKVMAALHAASFVLQHRAGNKSLGEIYQQLNFETEASDVKGHPGNAFYEAGIRSLVKSVEVLLPGYSPEQIKEIQKLLPDRARRVLQLVKPSNKYKNIFIHGDLWCNNMLFRKANGGGMEALLIDFQFVRFAPPAHDIAMMFHLCQNAEFRKAKEQDLLEYYHQNLTRELSRHGLTPTDVELPLKTLVESYHDYHEFGLLCAAFYFPVLMQPGEVGSKFLSSNEFFDKNMFEDRSEIMKQSYHNDEIFKTRVGEVIEEFVRLFVLGKH